MSETKICKKCGNILSEGQDFCTKCGTPYGKNTCAKCGAVIEEGQDFCPKCGNKVGVVLDNEKQNAIDEFNKNLKNTKKKKKKGPIVAIIIIAVLALGVFIWLFKQADWSFGHLKTMISEKHYPCFIEHSYEDANCQHGKLCKECGLEIGEIADHNWVEASCTEPKHCTVCELTEGKAKGHSVGIGKCSICGEFSTELLSEAYMIYTYYTDAVSDFGEAVEYLQDASSSYYLKSTYVSRAQTSLKSAKKNLQNAAEACGSYSEFSSMKESFTKAANAVNTTSSYYSTLASDAGDALGYLSGIEDTLKEWTK